MQIKAHGQVKPDSSVQEIVRALLAIRGVKESDIPTFLTSKLPSLPDLVTSLGLDQQALSYAKDQVTKAIKANQSICVYGDYDADGITATAIMWLTLTELGARVLPFIPSRTKHGYGLSKASVAELLSGKGFAGSKFPDFVPDVIITVDNGIVAGAEIETLRQAGKIVIVTDHHQPDGKLSCDALLHSLLTSGAGISWVVSRYLSDDLPSVKRRIDLAAIGIVADQMPVTGVNRAIIQHGLKAIEQTNLLGLYSILMEAGILGKSLTTYDVNFVLAPRINAVGRIDNALDALRLLCTSNKELAKSLSSSMELLNKDRQDLTKWAVEDALKHLGDDKITIVASASYHHGVIGLIAGKLAEHTHKPALAMSISGNLVKGSARSVTGVNVTALLRRHAGLLISVGGHEQAAGFSLETSHLDEFVAALTEDANINISAKLLENTLLVDLELTLSQSSLELARALETLEPFGIGNLKPRFVTHNLNVVGDRVMGALGNHHKLTVEENGHKYTILWFNGQSVQGPIKTLVYTLDINTWQNKSELQLVASYVEI